MNQQPIKRFIAGAVCPACSAMDTIKMYEVEGVPHRVVIPVTSPNRL